MTDSRDDSVAGSVSSSVTGAATTTETPLDRVLTCLLRWGIPAATLAALGYVLSQNLSLQELAQTLRQSAPEWLLLGLLVFALTNVIRAARSTCLLGWRPQRSLSLVPTMFASTLFKNVLPMRTGELSFPYLMQQHDVEWGRSLAILLVARLLDLLVVCLLFLTAAASQHSLLPVPAQGLIAIAAVASAVLLVLLSALPLLGRRALPDLVAWLTGRNWLPDKWQVRISREVGKIQESLGIMARRRVYGLALFHSLLIWLGTFAWFACFLRGIGWSIGFSRMIVGASFAVVSKSLPIGAIGGFGAHEAGWTLGFTLIGQEIGTAIVSGLVVNMLTLFSSALFGLASLGWMAWRSGRSVFSYMPEHTRK